MPESLDSCSSCRYFVPGQRRSTEQHDGSCHFGPPGNYSTPLPENGAETEDPEFGEIQTITWNDTTYTGWPIVLGSDWCGSHEPIKQTPPRRAPSASHSE